MLLATLIAIPLLLIRVDPIGDETLEPMRRRHGPA
jgi:hypothetical protein